MPVRPRTLLLREPIASSALLRYSGPSREEARIERLRQEARQSVPLQGGSAAREQHWGRNETLHHKIEQVPLSLPRS